MESTAWPKPTPIHIGSSQLSVERLSELHHRPLQPVIDDVGWQRLRASRQKIIDITETQVAIYGVNTGFGTLCTTRIPDDQLAQLQRNLILSHAVGVGPPIPDEIVRWMLLLKINALLLGASGIQEACVERLADMLSHDVLPVVPTRGSLGASGDLAPLSHMVLPLIGEGRVRLQNRELSAAEGFAEHDLRPVELGPKDGLALINGTQMMLAYALDAAIRARRIAKLADILGAMSLEASLGSLAPFSAGVADLRPHPGIKTVSDNICRMMQDSEVLASHANCNRVQDRYSLRCIPAVHGACRDALDHVCRVIDVELNSVTDNPVIVGDRVISGGNFHGEPLALGLDYLAMTLTEWANISERRTYALLFGPEGVPPLLIANSGVNSGFMIPQYTAAALVNECKSLSAPSSVDSIPSSLGQEDHVSMGATSALRVHQIVTNVETVLAIELLCTAQALDFRHPLKPGIGPRTAHEVVRRHISHADADRAFGADINTALEVVRATELIEAVEAAVGSLG